MTVIPCEANKRGWLPRIIEYLPPTTVGIFSFFAVLGGKILNPTNTAWMGSNDPAVYFLTWHFFRQTPWMWPLGANPNYGLDVSSSVFYGDAIPLLAIFFKVFSFLLPEPFQYWGFWLFSCFILQAILSWKLIGLLTSDRWIKLLATGIFVFYSPFLFRFSCQYSLCAHWLILSAIYLCVGPRNLPRLYLWPALIGLTAGIHSYLLFMVVLLWVSDAARRFIFYRYNFLLLALEGAVFGAITLLVLWASGFFMLHSGLDAQGEGLGAARLSLISIINPESADFVGKWSYVLPALPVGRWEFEGFAFPGLGILLLGLFCFCCLLFSSRPWHFEKEWIPVASVLCFLSVFALSNCIGAAHHNLIVYPVPSFVGALRATGRMFWPAFYMGLFLLIRYFILNHRRLFVIWLFGVTLALQVIDTSAGWLVIRRQVNLSYGQWATPLKAEFWSKASKHYHKVYLVPEQRWPDQSYRYFSWYATQNHMGTDAASLARVDPYILVSHNEKIDGDLRSGNFDLDSLYILDTPHAALALKSLNSRRDLLELIDGFTVLAPGWKDFY